MKAVLAHVVSCCVFDKPKNALHCFLNGPIPASFCSFSSFSHHNFNNSNWKKHRWCAWDSNLGPQDGRHRWNHLAWFHTCLPVGLIQLFISFYLRAQWTTSLVNHFLMVIKSLPWRLWRMRSVMKVKSAGKVIKVVARWIFNWKFLKGVKNC